MAAASGISATPEIEAQFAKAINDSNSGWLKVKIADETFQIVEQGAQQTDAAATWAAMQATIADPTEAAYFIVRSPNHPVEEGRWILVFHVPMRARVRDKMLFASSAAALKRAFGAAGFIADYQSSEAGDLALQAYQDSIRDMEKEEVLTWHEITKDAADIESAMMVNEGAGHKSIVDMPVKHTDEALKAMQDLVKGTHRTVVLNLNPQTEVLELVSASGSDSLEDAGARLEERVPRYILHRWDHEHPKTGEQVSHNVFVYYCPGRAPPRSKMFFSACKSMLVDTCRQVGFDLAKNLELGEPAEVSTATLREDLYPPEEEVAQVAKPKARGGGRRKVGKFNAAAAAAGGDEE